MTLSHRVIGCLSDGMLGKFQASGITLLALGLFWVLVVSPLRQIHTENENTIKAQQILLLRLAQVSSEMPSLEHRLTRNIISASQENAFLIGSTNTIVAARLQERLSTLSSSHGLRPSSIEILPASNHGQYQRISVRLTFSSEWQSFIKFLETLSMVSPRLLVDDLQIQANSSVANNDAISVSLKVIAFRNTEQLAGGSLPDQRDITND